LRRTLDDLAAFAGYAIPLIDLLHSLPAAADWGEWLDQLGELATRALKQPDRVLAVLAELAPMAPIGPVTLSEILIVLDGCLLEVAVPPPSQRYGRIFVGPIEAARGLSFEAVFVPGLAEKMFPRRIVEEPILLDVLREQIGGGLVTNQSRLERERLALSLAAGAAECRICFSYPRLDLDQARPCVPSFYALEAVRAAEGRLPDFAELARRAATVTTAGSVGPRRPIPSMLSTTPSTISPSSIASRRCRRRAPGRPAIRWSRGSISSNAAAIARSCFREAADRRDARTDPRQTRPTSASRL
jgi:ATP-dependent helicase/nuclease subunit B